MSGLLRVVIGTAAYRAPEQARDFRSFHNYAALPRSEAFRI